MQTNIKKMTDLRFTVGYKTALRHVIQWFDYHDDELRYQGLFKAKGYKLALKKMLENADRFMEEADTFEFRITEEEVKKAGGKSKEKIEAARAEVLAKNNREWAEKFERWNPAADLLRKKEPQKAGRAG